MIGVAFSALQNTANAFGSFTSVQILKTLTILGRETSNKIRGQLR